MKDEACWEVEQAMRHSALDVFEASGRRANWCRTVEQLFKTYDFLALPTAQCFPFDARVTWPRNVGGRAMDSYSRWMEVVIYATLAGCPVINVPAGFSGMVFRWGFRYWRRATAIEPVCGWRMPTSRWRRGVRSGLST